MILGAAVAGDWTTAADTGLTFLRLGFLPALLLTLGAIVAESRSSIDPEAGHKPAWLLAHGYVLGAVVWVAWVRPWR